MKINLFFVIFVITSIVFTSCVKQEEKPCPLMYKLQPSAFAIGIDSETCLLLSSLQNISSLTPPITVADIRNQLEAGQVQPFSDAGFDQFLSRLYALDLDTTALTAGEITVLNVIREYLDPAPNYSCCVAGTDYPSVIADVDLIVTPRVGSPTFEHSVDVRLNSLFSCNIHDIQVNVTFLGAMPTTNPFVMDNLGCVDGKQSFKFLWMDFAADPSGSSYGFSCDFRDSTGAVLSTVNVPINL